MKALVVEDDLSTRLLIKKIAENEGYEILEAEDGNEGWKIFQKEKDNIYIALLDWMMPKMDGQEIKNWISLQALVLQASSRQETKRI